MGQYVVNETIEIRQYLDSNLSKITQEIICKIGKSKIDAIVLGGSFGRGEGSICIKNDKLHIVNDIDITVFLKPYIKRSRQLQSIVSKLCSNLANELGIKQIDISLSYKFRYLFYEPTVSTLEFIHGNQPLYGAFAYNKLKRRTCSQWDKLPHNEGLMYIYTRGSGLLIAMLLFHSGLANDRFLETFLVERNKAHLAMGDTYLLHVNEYKASYKQRLAFSRSQPFKDLPNVKTIQKKYIEALEWKISPTLDYCDDAIKAININETLELFINHLLWFEGNRLNRIFPSVHNYNNFIIANRQKFRTKPGLSPKKRHQRKMYNIQNRMPILTGLFSEYLELTVDADNKKRESLKMKTLDFLNSFHPEGIIKELSHYLGYEKST